MIHILFVVLTVITWIYGDSSDGLFVAMTGIVIWHLADLKQKVDKLNKEKDI